MTASGGGAASSTGPGTGLWLLTPSGQTASGDFIDDTLRERARERGMQQRLSGAGVFPRQRVEVLRGADAEAGVNELYYRRGWTDGLPVVAPTLARVDAALAAVPAPRDSVVAQLEPLQGLATLEKIAANAVMAGCLPQHLPLVVAAVEAIADPQFNLRGVQTTDENVTPLLILSGPGAAALEVNDGFGALGPGWRGSASIGRALRLVMNNIGGGWPGAVSLAGLGQPGRFSLCLAEQDAATPWPSLRAECGFRSDQTVLTVMRAESVVNVSGGLAEVASVMGSATSAFSMAYGGKVAVVLSPFTARSLAGQGMSKDDVKCRLHEEGRVSAARFASFWLRREVIEASRWPDWLPDIDSGAALPVVQGPDDITVVVAGGDLPIAQHAYMPTWGFPPCRVHRVVKFAAAPPVAGLS